MASPYMLLNLPAPSVTPGPEWAQELVDALNTIDGHDHTSGFGARVPAAGLNINSDLPFGGNNATVLRTTRFQNLGEVPALATDVACLAVAGGNLYYVNSNGQAVQITAGPNINLASIGAIGGDYSTSTASEVYIAAITTFQFFSDVNKYASLDGANVTLRESGATNPKGITLKSPGSLAADYELIFPAALPNDPLPLVSSSSGVLSFSRLVADQIDPDAGILGSQLADNAGIVGTQLAPNAAIQGTQLAAEAGILGSQLAEHAGITGAQLAAGAAVANIGPNTITTDMLAALVTAVSASSGTAAVTGGYQDITNLSVAFTSSPGARLVMLVLEPDGVDDHDSQMSCDNGDTSAWFGVRFTQNGTAIHNVYSSTGVMGIGLSLIAFATQLANTAYTYKVQAKSPGGGYYAKVNYYKLRVVEL